MTTIDIRTWDLTDMWTLPTGELCTRPAARAQAYPPADLGLCVQNNQQLTSLQAALSVEWIRVT
jgi:hypothetical protein